MYVEAAQHLGGGYRREVILEMEMAVRGSEHLMLST